VAPPPGRAVVVELDVAPRGPYRLPGPSRDGLLRRDGRGLVRLLHHDDEPVVVRVRPAGRAVRLVACGQSRDAARWAIERMRFALGLDDDLTPFLRAFRRDPLLGPALRRRPWLRPARHPVAFEALAWAVCGQLIESGRAAEIERRIVRRLGRSAPPPEAGGAPALRDSPSAAHVAGRAPAELAALDLAPKRAIALIRCAREVAAGRADLAQHEPCWRRLRQIPEIGSWTLECLGLHGQGRHDQIPAGDLMYLKLVGRLERLHRRATEEEVRAWFARYAPYQALAGWHLQVDRRRVTAGTPPAPWRPAERAHTAAA
jgi:3-methyladenine DNA glycosylase/8-oxoguanine DNA glycosylase